MTAGETCHLCGGAACTVAADGRDGLDDALGGVTSDCRPWSGPVALAVCEVCGTVQKVIDADWRSQCREIYASYRVYRQGAGSEPAVFGAGGMGAARSLALLERLLGTLALPEDGRLLDLGCGDGTLLRHAARLRPGWRLTGTDLGDQYRPAIEAIPGLERFHTGPLAALPGGYDLATALHVLEHIEDPAGFLGSLRPLLAGHGRLAVEVPDIDANPFDLLVIDHATHFSSASLSWLLRSAGFSVEACRSDWIARELSAIAAAGANARDADSPLREVPERSRRLVAGHRRWLRRLRDQAAALAQSRGVALFGTSIAASWLAGVLGSGRIRFFVDEDPARAGSTYLGRPVLSPADVAAGETVCMPMTPVTAAAIAARIAGPRYALVLPPPLP